MNRYKLVITFLALSLTLGGGICFVFSVWAGQIGEEAFERLDEGIETFHLIDERWEKERKRRAQAILELEPLAESGDSEAQFALGKMYHLIGGDNREQASRRHRSDERSQSELRDLANKNREHAEHWLIQAAEQETLEAQKYLWKDFYNISGLDFEYIYPSKKIIHWAQIAADRGDPDSQAFIGIQYQNGKVLLQDYVKALHWFHRAAEQGHERAMFHLGELYSEIKGVEEDLVQAHKWFNLAHASSKRDALAKKMTNEQIAEAQRLAREWKAKGK